MSRGNLPVQALKLGNPLALGYRGPNLRRPIASSEIMWLARLLVRASDAANAALGLEQPSTEPEQQGTDALQVHAQHLRCLEGLRPMPPRPFIVWHAAACRRW